MGAPVCNISPKNPPPQSLAPVLPSIPVANDLASALAALNAIRQWILQFTNLAPIPPAPNVGPGGFVQPSPTTVNIIGGRVGNFAEVPTARVVETTRIYDPNDPTKQTYVDVNQIVGLEFANGTGQTIRWTQGG